MPNYFYKARNLQGKEISGYLLSKDKHQLARTLHQQGYILVLAKAEGETQKKPKLRTFDILSKLRGVSLTEKLFFTRNLEIMIRTGVPLPRAFETLASQSRSSRFRKALKTILASIVRGESLSTALGMFPKIFPSLYRETIKVGETTGKIEDTLHILAQQMEKEYKLKSALKGAMIYPIFVLSATLAIGIFMMIFAVPKIKAAFEQLHVQLPFTTKITLEVADFLINKWYLAILIVVGFVVVFFLLFRSKKTSKFKSAISLKIPIVSKIVKETDSALALRTLSSLLAAGVPIVRALEIISGALGNFYFQKSFKEAAQVVKKGKKLSEALRPYKNIYSPMVIQMIQVGEETGESASILDKLANFYEEESANTLKKFTSLLEPILILFLGGIVGFFVVSMFQPMFSIMQGIK